MTLVAPAISLVEIGVVGLAILVGIVVVVALRGRPDAPSSGMVGLTVPAAASSTGQTSSGKRPYDSLGDALSALLADPGRVEFVIFGGRRGYVQFATSRDGGLHCEAASNAYLEEPLNASEQASIVALNWQQTDAAENYSQEWPPGADLGEIERIAAETLRVYGDDPAVATIETA